MAVISALRDGHVEDIEKLPAFVHGTARNLINNYLRTRRRRRIEVPLPPEIDVASFDNQFDQLDRSERLSAVNRALRQLDSTDRKILLLTLVEGSKPGEIAQQLRLTSEVVRTRKLRALRKITEIVKRMSRR
jgi:RNA polymerase sigma-70 factor (ECF subfamily)